MNKGVEKHPTQSRRIVDYINANVSVSTMQAIVDLGIINPAARVQELRAAGVDIVTTMQDGRNRFGERCRYAVYTIKGNGGE